VLRSVRPAATVRDGSQGHILSFEFIRIPAMWRQAPISAAIVIPGGLQHHDKLTGMEPGLHRVEEALFGCIVGIVLAWLLSKVWPVRAPRRRAARADRAPAKLLSAGRTGGERTVHRSFAGAMLHVSGVAVIPVAQAGNAPPAGPSATASKENPDRWPTSAQLVGPVNWPQRLPTRASAFVAAAKHAAAKVGGTEENRS
jgi:hypothetical protein